MLKLVVFCLLSILVFCCRVPQASANSVKAIIQNIQALESARDPKCYATASRLEDFMFGTPLSHQARFRQHSIQQQWAHKIWTQASELAERQSAVQVSKQNIQAVSDRFFQTNNDPVSGHWSLTFPHYGELKLHKDDVRQYSSIAYSLRALLAVQQAALMDIEPSTLLPLTEPAIEQLKRHIDHISLAVLKVADQKARLDNAYEIEPTLLVDVWDSLGNEQTVLAQQEKLNDQQKVAQSSAKDKASQQDLTNHAVPLLNTIIEEKIKSYAAYNQISNQLFVRNLQVYFARNRWPSDPEVGKQFISQFQEVLISFATDLYLGAQALALNNRHKVISEADVYHYSQSFIPHEINQYEDATFFPKLAKDKRVTIESYDMDAFRDSGIHWRYLQFAVNAPAFKQRLEPDPFAAELLAENIAQFGVLVLRITGEVGKEQNEKRLRLAHLHQAIQRIQHNVEQQNRVKQNTVITKKLVSTAKVTGENKAIDDSENQFFSDITLSLGVDYQHRSSDWLNRLLRSYLPKSAGVGNMTIPPAFGGAGIAAEDINNDGWPDLLILSGQGNRLYINQKGQKLNDVSESAGINWRRADGNPGEPRQPLIADLNNDGLQDIIITYVDDAHRVYQNLGQGKFRDVTLKANLGGQSLVGGPATLLDVNQDGLLDLYITYFGDFIHGVLPTLKRHNTNGLPNKLFINTGGFTFVDATKGSGLDNTGWAQAVTHTDLNGDGLQDLIVGNDFGVNAYYKNLGNSQFENIAAELGTDKPSYTMNISVADLNDDLRPDIYISNIVTMNKDQKYVLPNAETPIEFNADKLAKMRVVEANDLFLSELSATGKLNYQNSQLVGRGYSSTGWSWDADFFDFDNDGDSDLYVLNGMNEFNLYSSENPYYTDPNSQAMQDVYIPVSMQETNVFFVNDAGKLNYHTEESGLGLLGNSRSATYLDLDMDGDLDMALNNYHEAVVVYQNNSEQFNRHWLKVKLIGNSQTKVNRDAIGAQLVVTTSSGQRIWREIHSSQGYMSVHPKEQHFGLNKDKLVDLQVVWPNGEQQQIKGIKANQRIVIQQGQPQYTVNVH